MYQLNILVDVEQISDVGHVQACSLRVVYVCAMIYDRKWVMAVSGTQPLGPDLLHIHAQL